MIKEIAEPMFKTMLPGPLKTLHFTKIDLGTVPLRLNGVLVSKTASEGIKLDMNVDWDGECDIKLDADMAPEMASDFHPTRTVFGLNFTHISQWYHMKSTADF